MKELTCISLGPACPCASALQRNGLRLAAYPFDWIVSDASIVDACLTDQFSCFLDVAQCSHSRSSNSPCSPAHVTSCDHAVFGDAFFRHHCPLCVPEHHAYLGRATRRMLDRCGGEVGATMFLWMNILPADQDTSVRHAAVSVELKAMLQVVRRHVRGQKLILAIECYGGCDRRDVLLVPSSLCLPTDTELIRVRVRCASENTGCRYSDAADNGVVDSIIKEWHALWQSAM